MRTPSDDELASAFAVLRAAGRCRGCRTLEEALARPVTSALLRLQARLAAQGQHLVPPERARPAVLAPEPAEPFMPADAPAVVPPWALPKPRKPRRSGKASRPPQQPTAQLDRKRAAAGDRDDS